MRNKWGLALLAWSSLLKLPKVSAPGTVPRCRDCCMGWMLRACGKHTQGGEH